MLRETEVLTCMLDVDGSSRDINFTPTDVNGAARFLCKLSLSYTLGTFYNDHGKD